jgi:dienelactone hydrolase
MRFIIYELLAFALAAAFGVGCAHHVVASGAQHRTGPAIRVDPPAVFVDVPTAITVAGLSPRQQVTITATLRLDSTTVLASWAAFRADDRGRIDAMQQAPDSGTYSGVDGMGLIWSGVEKRMSASADPLPLPEFRPPNDATYNIQVFAGERELDAATLTQRFVPPSARRIAVRDSGLFGTLFVPATPSRPGVVIVLGGSEGGIQSPEVFAAALASHGFGALALAYFRAPSLPRQLVEIPLEYFELAVRWVKRREDLDSGRMAILGSSRGGELALLLASRMRDLRSVVAYSPINIVNYGVPNVPHPELVPRVATWTYRGIPIPFYSGRLPAPEDAPETIPVERINGPVLVIAGTNDRVAPSAPMGEAIMRRLARGGRTYGDTVLIYPDAGHAIALPYIPVAPRLSVGGTPADKARADRESWEHVLQFLRRSLDSRQLQQSRPDSGTVGHPLDRATALRQE